MKGTAVDNRIEQHLSQWYASPLGQQTAEFEQQELDRVLPDLFGYHLLQVGSTGASQLSSSRMLHRAVMCDSVAAGRFERDMVGSAEQLPVQPDCIDTVILHHTLDCARDPHQVLREAERVLVPEGHIIILGFNPYSFWGIRRLLSFGKRPAPWSGRFLAPNRVKDWLVLLGFEIETCRYRFFRPPFAHQGMLSRLEFMESWGARWWPVLGGIYLLQARKKVSTMTPIKPRWRPAKSVVSGLGDAASRSKIT